MKFSNTAYLLAALSAATQVLADDGDLEPTPVLREFVLPEAGQVDLVDLYGNHLDLRQATDINQGATQAATQAPAVTTFMMNKAVGATVTYAAWVYTQTFAEVPDQLPTPIAGKIGLGNLVKQGNGKRDAQPAAGSPVVLAQEQVGVTFWQQPMKRVTERVIIPVTATEASSTGEPPAVTPNGSPAWSPPYVWNTMMGNQTNATMTGTASGTATAGTARSIFPSQMNPAQHLPPYDDYGT
ncbi:hypothetical protein M409DRAFT_55951 [Zasmidium cellare ATCC 36951]|uniref:Uncharacterized protein n=1 Tax=Zasmidium cellare ATCC 36951 TaxID=1080233 RepID=A0A6A6CH87_ZASCE|nr:uncharacterized protein M409DRAFT_55951 [Zasmidium cellare ATCC 36951]KAF2165049.1 hypothetical protein M409DRAFT_55951 [Zasmidium cellare ATCC 36951]